MGKHKVKNKGVRNRFTGTGPSIALGKRVLIPSLRVIFVFVSLLPILGIWTHACATETLDLSGTWSFALDGDDLDMDTTPDRWRFPDTIELPGCLQAQGFGQEPSLDTPWTGSGWRHPELFPEGQSADNFRFPFNLQPPRLYVGPAWYQREIVIPSDWKNKSLTLHLERAHWQTTAWLDGRPLGRRDSLGTPQEFHLPPTEPGEHTLTLRIDNRLSPINPGPLSHSVTDATQGNWNGAVGRIELRAAPTAHISRLEIIPRAATGKVLLRIHTKGLAPDVQATVTLDGRYLGPDSFDQVFGGGPVEIKASVTEHELTVENARLWDEFQPNLYEVNATLDSPAGRHTISRRFGFRDLGTDDGRITINGRKTFLRGTLECCIFPRTGHPPTEFEPWERIIRICKSHGLNHMRFHSWCPPEAAFAAADQLGFYLQPEVSSWANQSAQIGSGRPLDDWLEAETGRMLETYGHHPSFVMFAYGNEPSGPNHKKWLQDWVARWKGRDPLRLYTTAAGWPVMPGSDWHSTHQNVRIQGWGEGLRSIINAQPPRTDFDWSDGIASLPPGALISHEIGQWCVYPNFAEIKKYTGYFKPRNFELFRDQLTRHGMADQAHEFLHAAGRLQVLAYKHDIEAALRTPRFGGFQLLDLHDFPGQGTALVGVLDAFWDSKPYCTPAEYSSFCGPTVPLIRAPRLVLSNDQSFTADVQLAHFGPTDLENQSFTWSLAAGDKRILRGSFPARNYATGQLHDLGQLEIPLGDVAVPAELTLMIEAMGTQRPIRNSWSLFVYPSAAPAQSPSVEVQRSLADVTSALAAGKSVLWLPPTATIRNDPTRPLKAGFSPIFWNTAWTNWQPPHTLGILCDPEHPALAAFPTDFHSNWQWWEIVTGSQPFLLTKLRSVKPVVQPIDDWFTNRKLGLILEARVGTGKLVACAADLTTDLENRPAARQLRHSLIEYMTGDEFAPTTTLTPADLASLVRVPPAILTLGAKATATSSEPQYPADAVIDDDLTTLWHTEYSKGQPTPPHDLTLAFPQPVAVAAVILTQRQDRNLNGQVDEVEFLSGAGKSIVRVRIPQNVDGHRIELPADTSLTTLKIRVHTSHGGPFASLAEVDIVAAEEQ